MRTPERDVVSQPPEDLLAIEVLAVGVAQREIVRADFAFGAIGNADAADVSVTEWPAGPAVGEQSAVLGLGIERNDADATQVG